MNLTTPGARGSWPHATKQERNTYSIWQPKNNGLTRKGWAVGLCVAGREAY